MANERQAAITVASFRSDAFLDFHIYRYYCCFDNNTLSIITHLRSTLCLQSEAFIDDFFSRCCGDDARFVADDLPASVLLLVTVVFIVTVSVCDLHTRTLSSSVLFSICDIKVERVKEISLKKYKEKIQAIYNNSRWWSAFSLEKLLYNQQHKKQQQQQLDVVFVQCNNQHHRESHHRGSTHFNYFYKTFAFDSNQLHSVVDFHFTVGNIRIMHSKKILVENIIFAYLISLDLYS